MVIAGLSSWHESHEVARSVLAQKPLLPSHAALETFSVLTRMPGRQRVDAATAQNVIAAAFPQEWLALDARETRLALEEFARSEITGGSVYDALIATTARLRGAALLSLDRRAASTYERVAAEYRLL